jgi:hypothetical protein
MRMMSSLSYISHGYSAAEAAGLRGAALSAGRKGVMS